MESHNISSGDRSFAKRWTHQARDGNELMSWCIVSAEICFVCYWLSQRFRQPQCTGRPSGTHQITSNDASGLNLSLRWPQ